MKTSTKIYFDADLFITQYIQTLVTIRFVPSPILKIFMGRIFQRRHYIQLCVFSALSEVYVVRRNVTFYLLFIVHQCQRHFKLAPVERVFVGGRGKNAGNTIKKCIQNRLLEIAIYWKEGKEWVGVGIEEGIGAKTFLFYLCLKRKNFMMRIQFQCGKTFKAHIVVYCSGN
jgi:hypothetical protein